MSKPIKMTPIAKDGALLSFDRPGRAEVVVLDGRLHILVYEGTTIDLEQEPLFAYDGTLSVNVPCTSPGPVPDPLGDDNPAVHSDPVIHDNRFHF